MTLKDSFLLASIVAVLVLIGFVIGIKSGLTNHDMLSACEAELPRNEHCIVIAVPEKGE